MVRNFLKHPLDLFKHFTINSKGGLIPPTNDVTVILYTGNVCSTPFLNSFKRIPGFYAPTHEHFDKYFIERHFVDRDPGQVFVNVLEDVYARQFTPLVSELGISRDEIKSRSDCPYFVFKWRPFVSKLPDTKRAQKELFGRINATPIVIVRRSLIEHSVKVVMTEDHYRNRWPQFVAAQMSDREYEEYINQQNNIILTLTSEHLAKIVMEAGSFVKRTKRILKIVDTLFVPNDCRLVVSEQFFRPLLDEARFNLFCSSLVGFPVSIQAPEDLVKSKSRKAGLSLSNIQNLEYAFNNKALRRFEHQYCELLNEYFGEFDCVSLDKVISYENASMSA